MKMAAFADFGNRCTKNCLVLGGKDSSGGFYGFKKPSPASLMFSSSGVARCLSFWFAWGSICWVIVGVKFAKRRQANLQLTQRISIRSPWFTTPNWPPPFRPTHQLRPCKPPEMGGVYHPSWYNIYDVIWYDTHENNIPHDMIFMMWYDMIPRGGTIPHDMALLLWYDMIWYLMEVPYLMIWHLWYDTMLYGGTMPPSQGVMS